MIDLIKECEGAKRIGISGHIRPDGDCVSSCLALRKYLLNNIPGAFVKVNLEYPPSIFSDLVGYDTIDQSFADEEDYDVYFALDCNFERLGGAQKYFEKAHKRINIDHHISNANGCGDVNCVEPEISSTAELLCKIMDKNLLDKDIAQALYCGMVTDSGLFQFSCTSPDTMRRAADLIEYGFDFSRLVKRVFFEKTYLQQQIAGRCLMESVRFMDERCVVGVVDLKTANFYGCKPKDYEGIVNQLINIRGIDVAIFMYQTAVMEYKVSLRSSEAVDVAVIAQTFGGGGHVRAAGCTMQGTFHDCVNNLSDKIAEQLGE